MDANFQHLKSWLRVVFIVWVCGFVAFWPAKARSSGGTTRYITEVQEQRRSTQWTLTEWLLIKERMRMMDLWLAMFSNPKQDAFRPEVGLSYGTLQGLVHYRDQNGDSLLTDSGTQVRGQIWLTNLVTATTRFRTLNIDFGVEGVGRRSDGFTGVLAHPSHAFVSQRAPSLSHWTANFRLFGKHIQDSSLVIKYGQYQYPQHLGWPDSGQQQSLHGSVAGAAAELYLWRWLGIESNYYQYGDASSLNAAALKGQYLDYGAFIEVSLLRLLVGHYTENWQFNSQGQPSRMDATGIISGIRLQL